MSDPYYQEQAEVAARLESNFDDIVPYYSPASASSLSDFKGLEGYTLLDVETFDLEDMGGEQPKAITVRDAEGNIYIHFRGTGNGFWNQNTSAYGPEASDIQKWSQKYCDTAIERYGIQNPDFPGSNPDARIYICGHSQGGNNAQYAMMTTKYADFVEACISLNGQGFSHAVSNDLQDCWGADGFEARRDKIWAYNGHLDFVSILGQEQVVRDDHTYIVQVQEETCYKPDGKKRGMDGFHTANWMIDESGHFGTVKPFTDPDNGESAFRKTLRETNFSVIELPDFTQYDIAVCTMQIIECLKGYYKGTGKIPVKEIVAVCVEMFPLVLTTIMEHPTDFIRALEEAGVFTMLVEKAKEYPYLAAALAVLLPFAVVKLVEAGIRFEVIKRLLEVVRAVVDLGLKAYAELKAFCEKVIEIVRRGFERISDWYRNTFNKGVAYVRDHPSFSADPDKLRIYASRVASVNNRLRNLDRWLNGLYLQVGFLDLLTILEANLLTSGSPALSGVQAYLQNTAQRLETAEAKAKAEMGG